MQTNNPFQPYENQWVALTKDYQKVLLSAKSLKIITSKVEKYKLTDSVVVTYVYPFSTILSP